MTLILACVLRTCDVARCSVDHDTLPPAWLYDHGGGAAYPSIEASSSLEMSGTCASGGVEEQSGRAASGGVEEQSGRAASGGVEEWRSSRGVQKRLCAAVRSEE